MSDYLKKLTQHHITEEVKYYPSRRMSMTKGISLNIGLNSVDPKHYGGWDGQLAGCENDANDMADIGATANFDVKKLLTKDATVDNLKTSIHSAAQTLESNDYF